MTAVLGLILLAMALIMTGLTGYWFFLSLFDQKRFSSLMSERLGPTISEPMQRLSALLLFPVMLVATILLVIRLLR